ncbi:major facilitator superfamily domain-containing protein [Phascolomyces articulosus]|uniref:Major facilitator superfamily domain-containing protein n=1 Tax=Phascolomyces articulosus TaxID=60185 RepID=A0AAD5K9T5_9FUNG|nr:major facilitator superfamily domain-containing protein [Phascolomyces articulosus]
MDSRQLRMPGYMLYCVLIATLGSFTNGWTIGSPNVPGEITHNCPNGNAHIADPRLPDCLPMDTTLWGFAVSSFCVGALIAGFFGGSLQTKLGRKISIRINTIPWIIGGILMGAAYNNAQFIIGRLIAGFSCGFGSVCIPTYIGEVSTIRSRGAMGTCHQFLIVIGILLASVIGLPTSNVPWWRLNYAIVGIPATIQLFLTFTIVESPRWLVSQNRIEEARQCLARLRGKRANIEGEFFEIVEAQLGAAAAASFSHNPSIADSMGNKPSIGLTQGTGREQDEEDALHPGGIGDDDTVGPSPDEISDQVNRQRALNIFEVFKDPLIRHITLLVLFLHFTQQWIGMNAVIFYSTIIFNEAFDQSMSQYMTIATMGVNFVATLFSVLLIDRMGRRALLLLAEFGCTLFSMLLVIGYRFHIPALLVVSVFMYVASFAIGIGPIPWMITSELCPTYANSSVSGLATVMNWSMNFVIGLVFPLIFEKIAGYTFCIFIGVGIVAMFVTFTMLPETKNRSIENIFKNLRTSKRNRMAPQHMGTGPQLSEPKQDPITQQLEAS